MPDLPYFDEYFPNWYDKPQKELGIIEIPVGDIVGGNQLRAPSYYDNWSVKRADSRYKSIENKILEEAVDRKKVKEIIAECGSRCYVF